MKKEVTRLTVLQGIGPETEKAMIGKGCLYAEDLIASSPGEVYLALESIKGITGSNLFSSYIPQALFMRISNMTGQIAEGLATSGIRTYRNFLSKKADDLVDMLKERENEGIIPEAPACKEIIEFQLSAAQLIETSLIYITLIDEEKKRRIPGANVTIDGYDPLIKAPEKYLTNNNGIVVIDGLVYGRHTLIIEKDGYKKRVIPLNIENGKSRKMRMHLVEGTHEPKIYDEAEGDLISLRGSIIKEKRAEIQDFPSPPPASVLEVKEDKIVLQNLWRKKIDEAVYCYYFTLPASTLPQNIEPGSVLIPDDNGKYTLSDVTVIEFRAQSKQEFIKHKLGRDN